MKRTVSISLGACFFALLSSCGSSGGASKDKSPAIVEEPLPQAIEEQVWSYEPTFNDPQDEVAGLTWSLTGAPDGMTIDAQTGRLTWIPVEGVRRSGPMTLTARALGEEGISDSWTFELVVVPVNDAPVFIDQDGDDLSQVALSATRGYELHYQSQVRDVDDEVSGLHYALLGAPAGMTVDEHGLVSWNPEPGDADVDGAILLVTDNGGGTDPQDLAQDQLLLSVAVTNHSPVIIAEEVDGFIVDSPVVLGETVRVYWDYEQLNALDSGSLVDEVFRWSQHEDLSDAEELTPLASARRGYTREIAFTPEHLGPHYVQIDVTDVGDRQDAIHSGVYEVHVMAEPDMIWSDQVMTYGNALGLEQLSARTTSPADGALVTGQMTYAYRLDSNSEWLPIAEQVLPVGTYQLQARFQPDDSKTFESHQKEVTLRVEPAVLHIEGLVAADKVYDGTASAVISGGVLQGVIAGDDVSVAMPSAGVFASKDVAGSIAVSVAAMPSLTGADAKNYQLDDVDAMRAGITPAPLTLSGLVASDKVYDGTAVAAVSGGQLQGVIKGDDVTISLPTTGSFSSQGVGDDISVTVSSLLVLSGGDAHNYDLTEMGDLSANIAPAPLTISGLRAVDKVYDASTTATLAGGHVQGVIGSDDVSLALPTAGDFASEDVANDVEVTVASLPTLTGSDAANYELMDVTVSGADITPVSLTITGLQVADKVYDGTTAAVLSGGSLQGAIAGDDVSVVMPSAGAFASSDVAEGISVSLTSALSLTGQDAGNYVLSMPVLVADITPASLTISGLEAVTRWQNGTGLVELTGGQIDGVLPVDVGRVTVQMPTEGHVDSAAVGENLPVVLSPMTLMGLSQGNYQLVEPSVSVYIVPLFTDMGNGTFRDNQSNKIWLQRADLSRTWGEAMGTIEINMNGEDDGGSSADRWDLTDKSKAGEWQIPTYMQAYSMLMKTRIHNVADPYEGAADGRPFWVRDVEPETGQSRWTIHTSHMLLKKRMRDTLRRLLAIRSAYEPGDAFGRPSEIFDSPFE